MEHLQNNTNDSINKIFLRNHVKEFSYKKTSAIMQRALPPPQVSIVDRSE